MIVATLVEADGRKSFTNGLGKLGFTRKSWSADCKTRWTKSISYF